MDMRSSQNEPREGFVYFAPWRRKAAVTTGMIALLLFWVAGSKHRMADRRAFDQSSAADQRTYQESKDTLSSQYRLFADLFAATDESRKEALRSAERYQQQAVEIDQKVRELEAGATLLEHRVRWLYFGEALLEIAIVVWWIAIVTQRAIFWYVSLLGGVAGAIVSLLAYLRQ
jgi:hypothetical protein